MAPISERDGSVTVRVLSRSLALDGSPICFFNGIVPHEDDIRYHSEPIGGPLFYRPEWQFDTRHADANYLIVDVTEHGLAALKNLGKYRARAPATSGSGKHDFMASHIYASIDLACRAAGHRFVHQDEILDLAKTDLRIPVAIEGQVICLIPDRIFAIEYDVGGQKRYSAFALEADRRTEPNTRRNRKTFEGNLLQYQDFIDHIYRDKLGLDCGMLVLNVTTSKLHMRRMIEVAHSIARSTNQPVKNYMLFRYLSQFGRAFRPPEPLPELFTDAWIRAGYPPFYISQQ